jgi:hypothetical protein
MYTRFLAPRVLNPSKCLRYVFIALSCIATIRESPAQSSIEALAPLQLSFNFVANSSPLKPNTYYINPFGERYQVRTLMFYVSRIRLSNSEDTTTWSEENYHLIDYSDAASHQVSIPAPKGIYNTIQFMVGVDSFHNTSGAQTGALDPVHGMFWTWNSGYIFAKFEGLGALPSGTEIPFAHHVGGFRPGEDAQRLVHLNVPPNRPIKVSDQHPSLVEITVEVARWFNGSHALSLKEYPTVMTPGMKSMLVADNISTIFRIQ